MQQIEESDTLEMPKSNFMFWWQLAGSAIMFLLFLCTYLIPTPAPNEYNPGKYDVLPAIGTWDVNSVSYERMRIFPIITDEIARGIIERRPFQNIKQLEEVEGIDQRILKILEPHFIVKDETNADNE